MNEDYYYHAGNQKTDDRDETVFNWSNHTRRTKRAAQLEAARMAKKHGGKPVVERWKREHGLRPGWDCTEES
jgi:hypothetical protein